MAGYCEVTFSACFINICNCFTALFAILNSPVTRIFCFLNDKHNFFYFYNNRLLHIIWFALYYISKPHSVFIFGVAVQMMIFIKYITNYSLVYLLMRGGLKKQYLKKKLLKWVILFVVNSESCLVYHTIRVAFLFIHQVKKCAEFCKKFRVNWYYEH